MKFISSLALVLGVLTAAVAAQDVNQKYPFRLRAWRDQRWATTIPVNHHVELDDAGNAIINKTAGYQGFDSVSPNSQSSFIIHIYRIPR